MIEKLIEHRVELALQHTFRLELGNPKTGTSISQDERKRLLTAGFKDLVAGMGVERFIETPVELLDQFVVMSVLKNHDTAGLLRSLVNSFVIAYAIPETADRAFGLLEQTEALRAEVAQLRAAARKQSDQKLH